MDARRTLRDILPLPFRGDDIFVIKPVARKPLSDVPPPAACNNRFWFRECRSAALCSPRKSENRVIRMIGIRSRGPAECCVSATMPERCDFPPWLFLWNNVSGPFVFVCVVLSIQKLKGNQNNCDSSAAFVLGERFRLIPNAEIFTPVISMPQSKDSSRYTAVYLKKTQKYDILQENTKYIYSTYVWRMLGPNERTRGKIDLPLSRYFFPTESNYF